MRILGIDPGIGRTGWGVIVANGKMVQTIAFGCIETSPKLLLTERIIEIFSTVEKLIKTHKPDVIAIEELFFNTNAKTALTVGQARGVVLLAASLCQVPVFVYTPLQVKTAVTGYGRADKKQIEHMVKMLLRLTRLPKHDDTSDALAIALTHAYSHKMNIIP